MTKIIGLDKVNELAGGMIRQMEARWDERRA
jgi:hypothetical protein